MQQLRAEIEPNLTVAQSLYQTILGIITDYTDYCDQHGDEEWHEYQRVEAELAQLTGKDISEFNLWEWWEEEGKEVLAFRIALPDPTVVDQFSWDELHEIVRRLKECDFYHQQTSFAAQFRHYLDSYYEQLLVLNFHNYEPELFQRNKNSDGVYFEYSIDQIMAKLWPSE